MSLQRLLAPRSIALIGQRIWTDAVAQGAAAIGYQGKLWRVHPQLASTPASQVYRCIADLPEAPDAAFVAVANADAPQVAADLARRGAGGFICFSAGFSETGTESGGELTQALRISAGDMPFLGPNCYGMVNFFDRVALWPDQVVGTSPQRGVALICQSGTIALTLMFNQRSLPIGYLISIGNQTRLSAADLIEELCEDSRVSAIGLYLEGIQDGPAFARAIEKARARSKPVALVKSGRTTAAARTAFSHTGALTGSDVVFDSFCRQAGVARCDTLGSLCETLKILHVGGPLAGRRVTVFGASGGDMALTSDLSRDLALRFPEFSAQATTQMRGLLSDRVAIANPFDIHTYLWFQPDALRRLFALILNQDVDAVVFMLDCPPEALCNLSAYVPVIEQFIAAAAGCLPRAVLMASLPENMSAATRERCLAAGVVPLQGQREALQAIDHAGAMGESLRRAEFPSLIMTPRRLGTAPHTIGEQAAKAELAAYGVPIPRGLVVAFADAAAAARQLGFPLVMKATGDGIAHKSDRGAVVLNITSAQAAAQAAERLRAHSDSVLVEEMIGDGVAELLTGVVADAQFGLVLSLAAGGVHAELWRDRVTLLPPWSRTAISTALRELKIWRLVEGYRGKPPGDEAALLDAILAVARYAAEHSDELLEIDINPLIVRPQGRGVVAVDALINTEQ